MKSCLALESKGWSTGLLLAYVIVDDVKFLDNGVKVTEKFIELARSEKFTRWDTYAPMRNLDEDEQKLDLGPDAPKCSWSKVDTNDDIWSRVCTGPAKGLVTCLRYKLDLGDGVVAGLFQRDTKVSDAFEGDWKHPNVIIEQQNNTRVTMQGNEVCKTVRDPFLSYQLRRYKELDAPECIVPALNPLAQYPPDIEKLIDDYLLGRIIPSVSTPYWKDLKTTESARIRKTQKALSELHTALTSALNQQRYELPMTSKTIVTTLSNIFSEAKHWEEEFALGYLPVTEWNPVKRSALSKIMTQCVQKEDPLLLTLTPEEQAQKLVEASKLYEERQGKLKKLEDQLENLTAWYAASEARVLVEDAQKALDVIKARVQHVIANVAKANYLQAVSAVEAFETRNKEKRDDPRSLYMERAVANIEDCPPDSLDGIQKVFDCIVKAEQAVYMKYGTFVCDLWLDNLVIFRDQSIRAIDVCNVNPLIGHVIKTPIIHPCRCRGHPQTLWAQESFALGTNLLAMLCNLSPETEGIESCEALAFRLTNVKYSSFADFLRSDHSVVLSNAQKE